MIAKILFEVQMYDTDLEITYNFWTGYQNLHFNEAFSISDFYFFNRRSSMVVWSVRRLVLIFNMAATNMNLILLIIC